MFWFDLIFFDKFMMVTTSLSELCLFDSIEAQINERHHSLSTYTKFYEKSTCLTLWQVHVRVPVRGLDISFLENFLYVLNGLYQISVSAKFKRKF